MSPGFTSRPSLSATGSGGSAGGSSCVAGIHVPAFVERRPPDTPRRASGCVAGIHVPAFVERLDRRLYPLATRGVSPGFTSRPSLSVERPLVPPRLECRVAGIHVPAFVERTPSSPVCVAVCRVSPGFTSRPSLSAAAAICGGYPIHPVSPGFTSRPSLSNRVGPEPRVNGRQRVAGIHVPAFVERVNGSQVRQVARQVSPGFTSRPSLSAAGTVPGADQGGARCRRDSRPGLR